MDVNLTGQIAETLAENLKPQIWNSAILFGVITAIITSAITFLAVRATNNANEKRDAINRNEEAKSLRLQEQWRVFSKLKGIQSALPQDYITTYQTKLGIIYQEAAARLHSSEENQRLHLDMAKALIAESHGINRTFAKNRQELYEIIGLILILFPNKTELHRKIDPIYSQLGMFESEFNEAKLRDELERLIPYIYSDLEIWGKNFDPSKVEGNLKAVEKWKTQKKDRISQLAAQVVLQQIEDLLNYLQTEMD